MQHEFSAGGVVVRRFNGAWQFVAIQPRERPNIWALPKGHIDGDESPEEAAVREVREETGVRVSLDERLGDVEYSFRAGDNRIHKRVTFFLLQWVSGAPMPQISEVDAAEWFDIERSHEILTYPAELELVLKASEILVQRAHARE